MSVNDNYGGESFDRWCRNQSEEALRSQLEDQQAEIMKLKLKIEDLEGLICFKDKKFKSLEADYCEKGGMLIASVKIKKALQKALAEQIGDQKTLDIIYSSFDKLDVYNATKKENKDND